MCLDYPSPCIFGEIVPSSFDSLNHRCLNSWGLLHPQTSKMLPTSQYKVNRSHTTTSHNLGWTNVTPPTSITTFKTSSWLRLCNEYRGSLFGRSRGPQPLRISLSLAMAELSVKSFALFMRWRVFETYSQICYWTGLTPLSIAYNAFSSNPAWEKVHGKGW